MTGEQGDRRVRRTKAMLRAALTELLKTKPVNEISVTELTRKADVNRGTFYAHYTDLYDMLEQMENEAIGECESKEKTVNGIVDGDHYVLTARFVVEKDIGATEKIWTDQPAEAENSQ